MTTGSLMKVKSIAECSLGVSQYFCPAISVIGLEDKFSIFLKVAVLHLAEDERAGRFTLMV